MNPTKWSKILESNSIHFEFRGTPSWKTRHWSWVINTKHWPVLQRTQSLQMNITMGVLVCPNSTVCGCQVSFAAPLCYTHVTSPGTFQEFLYKHVHLHVSSFSLWDFPSKSCFKPNQAQSWVDDLLSLVSQNGKSSWMRKRKDLLGFHFYDPSIQVWQEFCDHFLSQRTMVAMMPPAKAKTNCSWTPAAPKRRVTIMEFRKWKLLNPSTNQFGSSPVTKRCYQW